MKSSPGGVPPTTGSARSPLSPGGIPRSRASPYSPFPFGSPLTRSRGSVLNPQTGVGGSDTPSPAANPAAIPTPPVRLRGWEMFGGPVVFGGSNTISNVSAFLAASAQTASPHGPLPNNASLRRANRLLSAAPYHSSQRAARRARPAPSAAREAPSNTSKTTLSPESSSVPPALNLSATAQTILATLDQLSTPLRDALKIPVPRAEKRRAMAEELLEGSGHTPYWRRRPHLGSTDGRGGASSLPSSASPSLNGPPLRKIFTPLTSSRHSDPTTPRPSSQAKAQAQSVELVPRTTAPPRTSISTNLTVTSSSGSATTIPSASKSGFSLTQSLETPKSSFGGKIRAKVGDKAKTRADKVLVDLEESEPVPEFLQSGSAPKLEMAKMPAFSFSLPQSVPSSSSPHNVTVNGVADVVVSSSSPTKETVSSLDRNQAILTNPLVVNSVNSAEDSPQKDPSKSLLLKSSPPKSEPEIVSSLIDDVKFVFRQPKVLPTLSSSPALSHLGTKTFNFQKPIVVGEVGKTVLPKTNLTKFGQSPISQLPDLTQASSSSVLGHTHSISSGLMGFSYNATKFAPKLKAGNVTDVRGDNNRLPDVASGITPAQSLIQGSVMDILGRQSSF